MILKLSDKNVVVRKKDYFISKYNLYDYLNNSTTYYEYSTYFINSNKPFNS